MRLHRLEITAFGPFAETASVDFDALSEAGLFLLTGATGAGKTSVLDAVCFALYGEVPGDRQTAKRLRCDRAGPGVAPQVELELSLAGRRFRVIRSPAWERPKKRGTGVTTEQASVRLYERSAGGEWRQLSHRLDEAGHLVTHLVGMNLAQFCQVAMLPQGRFQAFLRARSEERHKLLQQLFRTGRFEDIERWLRDARLRLRRECARHQEVVADLVSRVSEAADQPLPELWDLHDLRLPAADGAVARWSRDLSARARVAALGSAARTREAVAADERSRAALDRGRRLVAAQTAHAGASAERDALMAEGPAQQARCERLAAARRAAGILPLQRLVEQHTRSLADAERACARCSGHVATLAGVTPDPLDPEGLTDLEQRAREAAAAARSLLPRERALADLRGELDAAAEEVRRLVEEVAGHDERLRAAPAAVQAAREAHDAAVEAGHRLAAARELLSTLRDRQRAGRLVSTLEAELVDARAMLSDAVDSVQRHKDAWLQLREERISGMAAELAAALAVGDDCPVCGSVDHPRPAPSLPGAPDAAAEKEARSRVDDSEAARLAHEGLVRDLTSRLAVAGELAGSVGPDELDAPIAAAATDVDSLTDLAGTATGAAAALAALEAAHARATTAREQDLVALTVARSTLAARQSEAAAIAVELAEVLDGSDCADLDELAARQDRLAAACRAALDAAADLDRAREARRGALREATDAARAAGFADAEAALGAALSDPEADALETSVREHDAALARVEALLSDPELRASSAVAPPDLPALEDAHLAAAAELADARTEAAVADARARRIAGLETDLDAALAAWRPVRAELELTTRVAALCDGTSPDNQWQMRLSGYVLAWRLGQVVAAANERLSRMSDQRYSLEHTGRRGAGENRGGLSLLVRDDWSGECRDPATLSGGETFVVSLALALGLADVIAHEVGGADLDTLFVDEGFGSLDADTLDDVMDTLDTLREGGRVVGVVSHVAEMRDRIPTQLRVDKSRAGSSLALAR